jgi:hypothetical protein
VTWRTRGIPWAGLRFGCAVLAVLVLVLALIVLVLQEPLRRRLGGGLGPAAPVEPLPLPPAPVIAR